MALHHLIVLILGLVKLSVAQTPAMSLSDFRQKIEEPADCYANNGYYKYNTTDWAICTNPDGNVYSCNVHYPGHF